MFFVDAISTGDSFHLWRRMSTDHVKFSLSYKGRKYYEIINPTNSISLEQAHYFESYLNGEPVQLPVDELLSREYGDYLSYSKVERRTYDHDPPLQGTKCSE